MVQDSLGEYGKWATMGRYVVKQLVQRGYAEKQLNCVDEWLTSIEKQIMLF